MLLCCSLSPLHADVFSDHVVVVFIDDETEYLHGAMPLDRALYASAIDKLADAGASGVVLKFFLDQPAKSDAELVKAMQRLPVLLQARLDNCEPGSTILPERFYFPQTVETAIVGDTGWLPVADFANVAHDIGFVDFNGFPVSLLQTWQDKTVKSLLLATLEFLHDSKAEVLSSGDELALGKHRVEMDEASRVALVPNLKQPFDAVPFHQLLLADDLQQQVAGKLVIIAYDGSQMQPLSTVFGEVTPHRLFLELLRVLINKYPPKS